MRDYTIDSWTEKIYHPKTREYFTEVIKSYYSESYRSAVVMLYSIVIVDLLYKLHELVEIYDDKKASDIIEQIRNIQSTKPNSAEWETKLIELINERMSFFEMAEYQNIRNLQKHRHLCAHPVLGNSYELYKPNREATGAHIRNMLDDILIKSPLLSKDIFEKMLIDLAQNKKNIQGKWQIYQYLNGRYLTKVSDPLLVYLFRNLWKVVFKLKSHEAESNRKINFDALLIFLNKNYDILVDAIQKESAFYSEIDSSLFNYFIALINHYNRVFEVVSQGLRILIENNIKENADMDCLAIFKSKSIEEHINEKVLNINKKYSYIYNGISIDTIIFIGDYLELAKDRNYSNWFFISILDRVIVL
jgi:hypothetical protein